MTSIEDRLRELAMAIDGPSLPPASSVERRGRQRRHRRRGFGVAAVTVVGAGAGMAVRALGSHGRDAVETADPGASGTHASDPTVTAPATTGSTTPGTRAVPSLMGLTVEQARSIVEDLGLTVDAPTNSDAGVVVSQDPAAGEPLHVGQPVTLEVADLERAGRTQGPVIDGPLPGGRSWTVGYSSSGGLCLTVGPSDHGCDDIGPVIAPGADPATPRLGVDDAGVALPEDVVPMLAFAFLPTDADTVELVYDDGRTSSDGLVIEPTRRFWAMPLAPEDTPDAVVYRDAAGAEVARFPLSAEPL